jgi:7,8-dihydroneopterin aldolase/epimerase/oxygenase
MDYIHVDNLRFQGKHGHYERERRLEQEFEVSARLGLSTAPAAGSDKLADTIDYDEVKKEIQQVLEGSSRYLLERLAEDIARALLKDARIGEVQVTIKKTAVWDNGVPGVTITRSK